RPSPRGGGTAAPASGAGSQRDDPRRSAGRFGRERDGGRFGTFQPGRGAGGRLGSRLGDRGRWNSGRGGEGDLAGGGARGGGGGDGFRGHASRRIGEGKGWRGGGPGSASGSDCDDAGDMDWDMPEAGGVTSGDLSAFGAILPRDGSLPTRGPTGGGKSGGGGGGGGGGGTGGGKSGGVGADAMQAQFERDRAAFAAECRRQQEVGVSGNRGVGKESADDVVKGAAAALAGSNGQSRGSGGGGGGGGGGGDGAAAGAGEVTVDDFINKLFA
ncbi:unnamed protein product, partial [Phaeothamnion confervicola]